MDRMIKPENVKPNDIMAFVYYGKVLNVVKAGKDHSIELQDLDAKNEKFNVVGDTLIMLSCSADQFENEKMVTQTQAAEILINCSYTPFTVCFIKSNGEKRVLRGRLLYHEPLMGRSVVEDLDLEITAPGGRIRQVDHRHILYIIWDGIKYIVSK